MNKTLNVLVPEEKYARLRADAEKAGITVSGYVRRYILGHTGPRFTDTEALNRCTLQMGEIFEVTAQLVRRMDAEGCVSPEQVEELISMYREVEKLVLELKAGRR